MIVTSLVSYFVNEGISKAMFGGKNIAAVFGGELVSFVEGDGQRCGMRLEQHFRRLRLTHQFGMLAAEIRIRMRTHIGVGPAEEIALADMGEVSPFRADLFGESNGLHKSEV